MKTYIRIKDCKNGNPLVLAPEESKVIIDEMVALVADGDTDVEYIFEAIQMEEEEYHNIPEFQGF